MSFFERTYETLYEYVSSNDDTISDDIAQECIQQLMDNEQKDNPIKMSESFINEEKVGIWKKVKIKLKENFYMYDKLSKDIDLLWKQWSRYLFEKESREAEKDLFSAPLTSPITSRAQFFSPGYTPSNPSPSPQSAHSSSPLNTSLPSPAPSNTSSSTYFSSPSPAPSSISLISDDIIERGIIQITTEDGRPCGHFKYAKKQNDKFICLTEDCRVSRKKSNKIRNEGVTRESLLGHAAKCHSIKLNLRLKTAVAGSSFTCDQCKKSFTRKQTLQTHCQKYHKPAGPGLGASLPVQCLTNPVLGVKDILLLNDTSLPEMFDGNIDLMNLLSPEELERIVPSPPDEDLSRLPPPAYI